jgi:hypothetical protein
MVVEEDESDATEGEEATVVGLVLAVSTGEDA